jgi:hypothetical protein
MKLTLNRTDRCNKNTHAQGIHAIYVKSIYGLLTLTQQSIVLVTSLKSIYSQVHLDKYKKYEYNMCNLCGCSRHNKGMMPPYSILIALALGKLKKLRNAPR